MSEQPDVVKVLSEATAELAERVRAVRKFIDEAEAEVAMHGTDGTVSADALRAAIKYHEE